MSPVSYDEALRFWYGRINYEQRSPKPADLKLDRMRLLLRLLGDPQERLRVVHVAGSKGKGSTSAMLATILREAGYRTGLFTSPHLCRVEERIQIDGQPISHDELSSLMTDIIAVPGDSRPIAPSPRHPVTLSPDEDLKISLTFFEIATALGFLHFARRRVDVAVLEVGLGGRFDSTNVCRPVVSVITSISFDHTQQLGDRLGSIAMEKAGIIKPGRPAVSGVAASEARRVIEATCRERGSPLRQLGQDFQYSYEPGHITEASDCRPHVRVRTASRTWPQMELNLLGEHQAANAAVAVATIEQLQTEGMTIPDAAVAAGLAEVRWPARLEVLGRRPFIVLDCAHNVASAQALVDTLEASFPPGRRLLIFAVSTDKDIAGMFRVLAPQFEHVFLTRYQPSLRAAAPEQLADILRGTADLPYTLCSTAAEAWHAARTAAGPEDLLCVTGSVFLAGELRPLLQKEEIANCKLQIANCKLA
ncbi:MAG TPA: folylpolyglutamate synthase/dihydrofolate synthase family protein [Gemmataceae bacterium]|nr:folylpolyglutamate synthase/dihydrofolate synthase family protein [Gemmataceae bacterium]